MVLHGAPRLSLFEESARLAASCVDCLRLAVRHGVVAVFFGAIERKFRDTRRKRILLERIYTVCAALWRLTNLRHE